MGLTTEATPFIKQDEVSFLFVNFHHLLHEFDEPFVFPL
jgi:hypothetical protein